MATISSPNTPQYFPLLELPRELQDLIYEYALAEPGGLLIDYRAIEDDNQLKYTCRQLSAETRGLGLKVNEIYIHSTDSRPVIDTFALFISICFKRCRRYLRRIALYQRSKSPHGPIDFPDHATLTPEILELSSPWLLGFCVRHPHCKVILCPEFLIKLNHSLQDLGDLVVVVSRLIWWVALTRECLNAAG
ncbi:hypothetical protein K458DRAFT_397021 [Lentithecium fluviatile CBS 122367]|uniref:F-box domain-containing protein n=1 Tax=Lentithecium fluviatile CBS 122367 TaxID=1168545 RepID=A0A6G1IDW4_9PLEO|nr:hypothetical protein K458DRAFT_397021 [Lentithecium fluviatile CBS 122367]